MRRNLSIFWSDLKAGLKHISPLVLFSLVVMAGAAVLMFLANMIVVTTIVLVGASIVAAVLSLRE